MAGQEGELILGFVNHLERFVNFTSVEASFRSLNDETEVVQNLTRRHYGINLPGKGTSVAIEYRFLPDPMLDATAYVLLVEVVYRDGDKNHSEVVFNKTVTVSEPDEQVFNTETAFLFITLIGGIALSGYGLKGYLEKKIAKSSRSSSSSSGGSSSGGEKPKEVRDSWLAGTTAANINKGNNRKSPKKK